MTFRPGSIIIVIKDYTLRLLPKVIEFFTDTGIHTANFHGNDLITEALFKQGVVENSLQKYYDGKSVSILLEPRIEYFTDKTLQTVIKRWKKDIGMKYDYGSNIGTVLCTKRLNSKHRRRCSEHTARGYNGIYYFLGRQHPAVTPADIYTDAQATGFKYFMPYILRSYSPPRQSVFTH